MGDDQPGVGKRAFVNRAWLNFTTTAALSRLRVNLGERDRPLSRIEVGAWRY